MTTEPPGPDGKAQVASVYRRQLWVLRVLMWFCMVMALCLCALLIFAPIGSIDYAVASRTVVFGMAALVISFLVAGIQCFMQKMTVDREVARLTYLP